jgi:hypothetical protein
MDVHSLAYEPFVGGPRSGLFALSLVLSGVRAGQLGPAPLAREVEKAFARLDDGRRLLSIEVGSVADLPEREMSDFLRLLRDAKVSVSVSLDGREMPSWLDLVPYRVAVIGGGEWMGWRADEIHWHPGKDWTSPWIGDANKVALRYIVPPERCSGAELLAFLGRERGKWGVIQRPKVVYSMEFIRRSEE